MVMWDFAVQSTDPNTGVTTEGRALINLTYLMSVVKRPGGGVELTVAAPGIGVEVYTSPMAYDDIVLQLHGVRS